VLACAEDDAIASVTTDELNTDREAVRGPLQRDIQRRLPAGVCKECEQGDE
jgi:hypothetical protein